VSVPAGNRTAAAVRARREHTARLLRDVQDALRTIHKDRLAVTFRGVASRAGVSRTFLYENTDARGLVESAIATTGKQRTRSPGGKDREAEASWRERALNAEDALTIANREIVQQRQRIADLLGQILDLEQADTSDGVQRLATENTSLKQRVRQLDDERQGLVERLEAARSNNRFLDRRLAALEVEVLERSSPDGT